MVPFAVRGLVLSMSALIIFAAGQAGVPLAESDVASAATAIGLAAGSLWTLYGIGIKAVVAVQQFING